MPKNLRNGNFRGRGGRNYGGDRFYDNSSDTVSHSHDDRTERGGGGEWNDRNRNDRNMTNVQRRVSFKPFSGGRGKGRITENQMRAHFNDDDEAMGGDTFDSGNPRVRMNNRNFDRQRRSGSPIPRGMHNDRNLSKKLMKGSPQSSWYEVKIPHGQKFEKDFILRSIQQAISPLVFIPLYYKANDFFASFFVEDYKVGSAILQASRTIETPDGRRLTLNVRNNQPPTQMNDQLKARMKQAMEKRYNPHTKALDLHKFHADSDLSDMFCSLARPQIMLAAMDIIAEHIPALEALNLNENRLYMLDHLRSMAIKLPHLKILHLAKNRIPYLNALDSLKNLKLVELNLEDNPLRKQFDDNTTYISEVRKRFPKVIKLDNLELPPPISFDIPEDNIKLPEAKASFLCDAAGADIVRQFLEQYYAIYDSDNRQPLLEAYHEHVMFSHTINASHQTNQQKMGVYMNGQRNIKQKTDLDSRCRLLKQGRLQVVSYLSSLPSTKHDLPTFAVDLTLFTPHMLQLTVNGTFKERKGNVNSDLLRSFQRTFVIVPANGGFCIRNEMIHINIATRLQEEKSFKPVSSLAMAQPATPAPAAVPTISTAPMMPDDNTKLQMIQALSAQTKMTTEWSKLCLQENNWDYQRAEFSFTELHKQNRIPPGAFITN